MKTIQKKLLIGLCSLALIAILFSPIFSLKKITIKNELYFISKQKCQIACETLLEKNIFWILGRNLVENALKDFYQINKFEVKITGKNELELTIVERAAWLSTINNGQSIFIDKEGYILKTNSSAYPVNIEQILIVKGLDEANFSSNKMNKTLIKQIKQYEKIFKQYFPNNTLLLEQLNMFSWNLILDDSIKIELGDLDSLHDKFTRIAYVIENDKKKYHNIRNIDVRINNKVLVVYDD